MERIFSGTVLEKKNEKKDRSKAETSRFGLPGFHADHRGLLYH